MGLNWLRILENCFGNTGIQPWALLPDFNSGQELKLSG
jgi:hypothetical protein